METEKIGFFKRVKMAIFNLEKYNVFANENFSKSLKYLLLLTTIVTVILAISTTINLSRETGKLINFVKSEEFPDFELSDGKLDAKSKLNAYDEEYNSRLIIDTSAELSDEKIKEYEEQLKDTAFSAILLKDKIIYKFDESQKSGIESTYNNVTSIIEIDNITKEKLVKDFLNNDVLLKLEIVMFIYAFLTILILNILTLIEDILIVGVFGWIAGKISKVPLALSKAISLAIYSLTLSIILSTIYSILLAFTGFEIKYFEIMYMIIAYIYIVAAIMIMKDGDRTAGEAVTVEGEILKTTEEDSEDEENDEEKKDDKKKKSPENDGKNKDKIPEKDGDEDNKTKKDVKGDK